MRRRRGGLAILLAAALAALAHGRAGADIGGCPVFPADNIWNTRVDTLPVHPLSAQYVNSIGLNTTLHPDFGAFIDPDTGEPIGIPFITVPGTRPQVTVMFTAFGSESDPSPYRIPPNAPIENGPGSTGDRHVLVIDTGNCILEELFHAFGPFPPDNHWTADSAARFDLRANALRTDGFTSADAAGLPIFPGLVRRDEADSGVIRHAFRFTAQVTQQAHVWPARHDAGSTTNPAAPPMGQRFRLKASVPIGGFTPRIQAIFQAFKTYGLMLADNGSNWFISGTQDPGWDDSELVSAFAQLHGSDFEAVDVSILNCDPTSARACFTGGVYVATGDVDGVAGAEIITGAGAGDGPHVKVFKPDGTLLGPGFFAYPIGFTGGVRVAACDFNSDTRVEIVTGAGPGGGPHVRVIQVDAAGTPTGDLASFFAYAVGFTGGVFVACGDVNGDGVPDIITGADAGGGPHVRVFSGANPAVELASFFAYSAAFTGGVRVAAGDVNGDGIPDIITAPGPGGGPHVRVFSGANPAVELASFFAYAPAFTGGVFVAAGNVNGDGKADIITAAGSGGGPHVRVFSGANPTVQLASFFAYSPGFTGGVRVGAGNLDAVGLDEIVTAPGPGGGPHVRAFTGTGAPIPTSFFAY